MPWAVIGAIALVAVVGAIGGMLNLGTGSLIAALIAAGAIGCTITLWQRRRRARTLEALEQAATRILSGTATSVRAEFPIADDLPPDLAPLAVALEALGERVRVQWKEVAKKTRNLEALIDAMDEPLLATDSADRVILCSRSAEAMLGAGGLVGRPVTEVFTQAEILDMHAAARAGEVRRGRIRVTTALGKRVYQVSAAPVPAAWGEGVFGAVLALRDVTELDQAVQVKTDFVANASHELRTPVAAIRTAAETLEGAAQDDPKMAERLRGMILAHAVRLEEMLRDLLDLSRLESPDVPVKIERIILADLERTLRQLSEVACQERRLTLDFDFEDELRIIRTDRRLLTLILRNLVENATKFAHEGTTVRIIGTVIESRIPAHDKSAGGQGVIRFEVIDKGVGIPLAAQERVFERYYQVDQARTGSAGFASGSSGSAGWKRGTGLGLAIVKHAAKALGGRVGLTSVWGQGTTVFAEIPVELLADEEGQARAAG